MKLIVTEKPSVARRIADSIGAKIRKDGYFTGGGYAVTWTFGHLLALGSPAEYGCENISREKLPVIPDPFTLTVRRIKTANGYETDPTALKQLAVIGGLLVGADEVITATDAARDYPK